MQVRRGQPISPHDGHVGVGQRPHQRTGDVARGQAVGREHDHDLAAGGPYRSLERVAGAPPLHGAHDDVGRVRPGHRARGHDHDLAAAGPVGRRRAQGGSRIDAAADGDQAGLRVGRDAVATRHRVDRPVDGLAVLVLVGRPGRVQGEGRAVVHDPPAGCLDARLELVRPGVVAGRTGLCAFLGQLDDRGRDR
jgi:hypothetical protein